MVELTEQTAVLSVDALEKSLGDKAQKLKILDGITFSAKTGEFLSLYPN
jgi:predicted ABC-type transport system involved in lysophospholipase L1 biosynthesis ATPase subunit